MTKRPIQTINHYTNYLEDVLSNEEDIALDRILSDLEDSIGSQIVIITASLNGEANQTKSKILAFPFLEDVYGKEDPVVVYEMFKKKLRNHIRRLDSIRKVVRLDIKLTTSVARHTYATVSLFKGIWKVQILAL